VQGVGNCDAILPAMHCPK